MDQIFGNSVAYLSFNFHFHEKRVIPLSSGQHVSTLSAEGLVIFFRWLQKLMRQNIQGSGNSTEGSNFDIDPACFNFLQMPKLNR